MKGSTQSQISVTPLQDQLETEKAIEIIKTTFSQTLKKNLNLFKVESPLILCENSGINDDLNGLEKPVTFLIKNMDNTKASIIQSLAKWKRLRLSQLSVKPGTGILTDMRALRPDDEIDELHSIYVDQWDWEQVIQTKQRSVEFLKEIVTSIYNTLLFTEETICSCYPSLKKKLPEEITFLHTEELLKAYPDLSPKERENRAAKEFKAIFLIGIGASLSNGEVHDTRAPDYDDWITETGEGYVGLNGDLIIWNPTLKCAFEISSMGIRVDKEILLKQLELCKCMEKTELYYHELLLADKLPQTIGGGIGQSRVSMFLLEKKHIGEVQASIWPKQMYEKCKKNNINLI